MTKYEPLERHLRATGSDHVPMSFSEIEAIIGSSLPPSSRRHRAWWSNNPSNSVITFSWLNAGYRTADVDMGSERLVFRRERAAPLRTPSPHAHDPAPDMSEAVESAPMPKPADALHEAAASFGQAPSTAAPPPDAPHGLFGRFRGALRVLAGVDVAVPADPGWADAADRAGRPE